MSDVVKEKAYFPCRDNPLQTLFVSMGYLVTTNPDDKDISCVVFSGGEDVTPFLYGENPHITTNFNPVRDMHEIRTYRRFSSPEYMKIGICRGAQFLNVMNGGKLWQDVDGHLGAHPATCLVNGVVLTVTSTHHQMMEPTSDADILLVANRSTLKKGYDIKGGVCSYSINTLENADNPYNFEDVEACFYEYNNALCYQPHPEYMSEKDCTDFFKLLVHEYSILRRNQFIKAREERIAKLKVVT